MLTSPRFMLTSRRVLSRHGRCIHGFRQINPVRWLDFALLLSLFTVPSIPAFADAVAPAGKGSGAPAAITAHGWAAMVRQ